MNQTSFEAVIGAPLYSVHEDRVFKVLCSCPASRPVTHTRRFIMANPQLYRYPTPQELEAFTTKE